MLERLRQRPRNAARTRLLTRPPRHSLLMGSEAQRHVDHAVARSRRWKLLELERMFDAGAEPGGAFRRQLPRPCRHGSVPAHQKANHERSGQSRFALELPRVTRAEARRENQKTIPQLVEGHRALRGARGHGGSRQPTGPLPHGTGRDVEPPRHAELARRRSVLRFGGARRSRLGSPHRGATDRYRGGRRQRGHDDAHLQGAPDRAVAAVLPPERVDRIRRRGIALPIRSPSQSVVSVRGHHADSDTPPGRRLGYPASGGAGVTPGRRPAYLKAWQKSLKDSGFCWLWSRFW